MQSAPNIYGKSPTKAMWSVGGSCSTREITARGAGNSRSFWKSFRKKARLNKMVSLNIF